MKKLLSLFFLLSMSIGFSQENYSKISKEPRAIKSTEIGLNIGDAKGFMPNINYNWVVTNVSNTKGEDILNSLTSSLAAFGFVASNKKYASSAMSATVSLKSELPSDKFRQICKEIGIDYLIIGERIKFINAKG